MMFVHGELTIDSKPLLDELFRKENIAFSERNFSTLYLYRKRHDWKLLFQENGVLLGLTGKHGSGSKVFMPAEESPLLKSGSEVLLGELAKTLGIRELYPIQEISARFLSLRGHHVSCDLGDGDYMMSRTRLSTYAGRALDGKRNFVHQFLSSGEASVQCLSDETKQDALSILSEWDSTHNSFELEDEAAASREGVEKRLALGIEGWIAYLDGVPQAVCYGEPLTEEVFLIHCAKARDNAANKALPYLHQEVSRRLLEKYALVNWEQDLGLMGLRRAKLAYQPVSVMAKWKVVL